MLNRDKTVQVSKCVRVWLQDHIDCHMQVVQVWKKLLSLSQIRRLVYINEDHESNIYPINAQTGFGSVGHTFGRSYRYRWYRRPIAETKKITSIKTSCVFLVDLIAVVSTISSAVWADVVRNTRCATRASSTLPPIATDVRCTNSQEGEA